MPNEGQNVLVTLTDGSELLAYYYAQNWWIGQEDNPLDVVVDGVVSWRMVE